MANRSSHRLVNNDCQKQILSLAQLVAHMINLIWGEKIKTIIIKECIVKPSQCCAQWLHIHESRPVNWN